MSIIIAIFTAFEVTFFRI